MNREEVKWGVSLLVLHKKEKELKWRLKFIWKTLGYVICPWAVFFWRGWGVLSLRHKVRKDNVLLTHHFQIKIIAATVRQLQQTEAAVNKLISCYSWLQHILPTLQLLALLSAQKTPSMNPAWVLWPDFLMPSDYFMCVWFHQWASVSFSHSFSSAFDERSL